MRYRSLHILYAVVSGVLMTACGIVNTARVALPDGFAIEGEGLAVKGRAVRHGRTPVRFGSFATTEMSGWSFPIGHRMGGPPVAVGNERLRFGFTMTESGEPIGQMQCGAERWFLEFLGTIDGVEVGAQMPVGPEHPALSCDAGGMPLVLWNDGHDLVGQYALPGGRVEIDSLRQVERGISVKFGPPVGLRFHRDGRDLMVLDRMSPGRVWFAQGVDQPTRRQLASAAAAMMVIP